MRNDRRWDVNEEKRTRARENVNSIHRSSGPRIFQTEAAQSSAIPSNGRNVLLFSKYIC